MKLLYITNGVVGAGGLERVLSVKASYLADNMGYEVHLLVLNQGDLPFFYPFSDKIVIHDITVKGNPLKYLSSYIKGIQGVINSFKPDFISVCDDGLKAFFLPIVLRKPCPMIYERHVSKVITLGANPSFMKTIFENFKFSIMKILGRTYDKFVVLTEGNIQEWNLKNLIVISNPLSFYPYESSTVSSKKVIAVGKQSYQKGYDLLLKSWKLVNQKHPDWELNIYGKHFESQKLDELSKELGISKSVYFFEPEKDIEKKYLESSIYVMSSRFEGFGMVLIEAMACGVPCVSYDCPCGPSDIIEDEIDGFLVTNGNIEEFAEKVSYLIENEECRKEFGNKAKENVKRYLPEHILQKWDLLFKTLKSENSI
ncbi:glycosyltransferase family 4 protein [Flavobacterium sp. SUN046]|uniref:glycosyltransferase family 4 protein n=1 Tax=Flavobacterium sp. SUN046 TaxID=3002440 RepID=UPI002DB807DA|nr:glycosyltransferase family 4 protein [Flavobacterium sp. SUN046]MEC4050883.1 glycosyltransferase family 4 protein [Flavobacterium sp. SUN046]